MADIIKIVIKMITVIHVVPVLPPGIVHSCEVIVIIMIIIIISLIVIVIIFIVILIIAITVIISIVTNTAEYKC